MSLPRHYYVNKNPIRDRLKLEYEFKMLANDELSLKKKEDVLKPYLEALKTQPPKEGDEWSENSKKTAAKLYEVEKTRTLENKRLGKEADLKIEKEQKAVSDAFEKMLNDFEIKQLERQKS